MALIRYRSGLVPSDAPPKLCFADYFKGGQLPPIPATFDRSKYFPLRSRANPYPLGMLGNDQLSDCTIAGAMHTVMLWNKINGISLKFTTLDAQDDYRDACGYRFGKPETDAGGDMLSVAAYWQKTGFRDCTARRHKIAACVSLDHADLDHLIAASYLLDGGVGLGLALPENAEQQFIAGAPWSDFSVNENDYHFVPLAYRGDDKLNHVYTWGADQAVTDDFLEHNCREAMGYVSEEALKDGRTIEGFLLADLLNDIKELAA